ncbi:hypothetical protein HZF08_07745 [Paenibacillus sp. CGMCC 1.16610]|uniref:Uncharacterized protein n=1 Tax=Paenibacillus anseongense TaxID=2682845 RepID=A0ABW9UB07_9BACL|nr:MULTISPECIES: hypothetical protein [Paenibacillus]MBA2938196.1 hypothetical protein [Paenibacillus sp. CGMCC 1.16610]MVQ37254.1 hypothetical protein [Paenibacillus anseongense]
MLTIEEYISRRKKEDRLNEFNPDERNQNMKNCVDYVFEYFNQYLDFSKMDEKTALNEERLEKYRKAIDRYDINIQEWLMSIYDQYDKQLNRSIVNLLKTDELFLIYDSDSEFRRSSYECYSKLVKKHPYLKNQTEFLFLFIKDYHELVSQPSGRINQIYISDEISEWIEKTWLKHQVNILAFTSDWAHRFYTNEDYWSPKHKIKTNNSWRKYEYDYKQKNNLFNLNSLFTRISEKPFLRGKKQFLEILMMYYWLHDVFGDEDNYWHEYLSKCNIEVNSRNLSG